MKESSQTFASFNMPDKAILDKTVLVSGADALFGDLMTDCLRSLRTLGYDGAVVILDFGLTKAQLALLTSLQAQVRQVHVPDRYQELIDAGKLAGPKGANVLLMKPYLPEILPDYDRFVFVDADCWFQTLDALCGLITFCVESDFVAVSQRSRFHDWDSARGNGIEFNLFGQPLRRNWYTMFANKSSLPKSDKKLMAESAIINAGVFSAHKDSPIWQAWQEEMYKAVLALPPRRKYGADQLGLGLAVYKHHISHLLLPEICNWHTAYRYDEARGLFTQTMPFYKPVSLMHLAGIHPHNTTRPVLQADGSFREMDLTFDHWQKHTGNS
ncbi:MAG: hypothetical protein ACON49_07355 [Candidatus Puniceispirillaceae bacterium]